MECRRQLCPQDGTYRGGGEGEAFKSPRRAKHPTAPTGADVLMPEKSGSWRTAGCVLRMSGGVGGGAGNDPAYPIPLLSQVGED